MNVKYFIILFLSFFIYSTMSANEKTKAFELVMPEEKVENSLYNQFEYLDSRENVDNMGYVQVGMMNAYRWMIDETPLSDQLNTLANSILDETAQNRTMLFQLRDLHFSEITKSMSEAGYCHIRISLYEKKNSDYFFIATMDTLITVKAMDVTGKLLKTASSAITSFVSESLFKEHTQEQSYLMTDVRNIDFYEKIDHKAYNTDVYEHGIYPTFQSFLSQSPLKDQQLEINYKDNGDLDEVKVIDPITKKKKKIDPRKIFAVVDNEQVFITSNKNYIPVYIENNDFKFIADGNVRMNVAIYAGFGLLGGLVGAAIASSSDTGGTDKVIMKVDHLNGKLVMTPDKIEQ